MPEGFMFRHDSCKNPPYDQQISKQNKLKGMDKKAASQSLLQGDNEKLIMEKIKSQWKTMRKAFMDLNMEKTGKISIQEFKFYLNFWGLDIAEKEIIKCFNNFDVDKDGFISYKDF